MRLSKYMAIYTTLLAAFTLSSCSTATHFRSACAGELDAAWQALDAAKADGFEDTASYVKAFSLLTSARTMQTVESFDNCYRQAKDAHFYIRESRKG